MPMQAESLEVLEKADLAPAQARAIVRAIEIELEGAKVALATKSDVTSLGQNLREEMGTTRGELRQEIAAMGTQLRQEMAAMGTQLRQEMAAMGSQLRLEMAEMRGELRAEIHASASSIVRQMYGALLGQMAVLLGFAYFFATHVR